MYCSKCGKSIPDESTTCPLCGCDLTFESGMLREQAKSAQKTRKPPRPLHIAVGCAGLLTAAVCVFLFVISPRQVKVSSTAGSSPASAQAGEEAEETASGSASQVSGDLTEEIEATASAVSVSETSKETAASTAEFASELASLLSAEPTPTPTVTPMASVTPFLLPEGELSREINSSYGMIPYSSEELVSYDVLESLTPEEIRIARNEIYARHGLIFGAEDLNEYFSSMEWYEGTVTDTDSIELNEIEQQNIQRILEVEG